MVKWLDDLRTQFILSFIKDNRWQYLTDGVLMTLQVTFFALLIGIAIGIVVAIVRSAYDKTREGAQRGALNFIFGFFNAICKIYLTVIRGTPVVVQLFIYYLIIFKSSRNAVLVAVITFGINSGAYVAEIFRSGIMSIDNGQFEAGRCLGFNYVQTMWYIVMPQAFKNVLPALANEFIVLLKETSVMGYVALMDLTKGAYIIIGRTYKPFMPLIAVALIYLVMVIFFSWLVGKLERRLRSSER